MVSHDAIININKRIHCILKTDHVELISIQLMNVKLKMVAVNTYVLTNPSLLSAAAWKDMN